MVVGHSDSNTVYLINFGTAAEFREESGSHIPEGLVTKFYGNLLFASPHKVKL